MGNKNKKKKKNMKASRRDRPAQPVRKKAEYRWWDVTLHILVTVLASFLLFGSIYIRMEWPGSEFETMLFYLLTGAASTGGSAWLEAAAFIAPLTLLLSAVLLLLQYDLFGKRLALGGRDGGREVQLYPAKHRWLLTVVVLVIIIPICLSLVGFFPYFRNQTTSSSLYGEAYVSPEKVEIKAPEVRRNLLVIEVESLETSLFTRAQGGLSDAELIPEMYGLLQDDGAVFFSSDDNVRGMLSAFGTNSTTGSLIAATSGIAFKVPFGQNKAFSGDEFLPGAWTLGDVLYENGYRNVLISAAETDFGGIGTYFRAHGSYDVIDRDTLNDYGLSCPDSQRGEWGFSDEAACRFAEEMMLRLENGTSDSSPWHMLISTIDDHFTGYVYDADPENGYMGSMRVSDNQLENAYATTSRCVGDLISWMKQQPFWEDTTVVIVGDHTNMVKGLYGRDDESSRARYNVILNACAETKRTKNRVFTMYDAFPTMLAAVGFEIPGNRLGLGVNLFSDEPTLAERYGLDRLNDELGRQSDFYREKLMGIPAERRSVKETEQATDPVEEWNQTDDFFAAHYVRPETAGITAPAHKRNLLILEIESMETTMFTKKQGGIWDKEIIPELYRLLSDEDGIYFASDGGTRGTLDGYMTKWTMASLIANTSGIPFIIPPEQNNSYKSDSFLYGAYAIGDVLADNGYRNVLITATRGSFGGVKQYFTAHGGYEIIDMNSVDEYDLSYPESQSNEWGFSDEASCKLAQEMMLRMEAESDQPWQLFVSTVDCHFSGYMYEADPDAGYLGSRKITGRQLENVYATTSRDVYDFITWLKQQPFYEDTTVVIIGDHTNMLGSFCDEKYNDCRGRYNLILNSAVSTENTKNRTFTAYDFYPTMLAALGFTIPGDRLGLGVNLFSTEKTLAETYGLDGMNAALEAQTGFYINEIMGKEDWQYLADKAAREMAEKQ